MIIWHVGGGGGGYGKAQDLAEKYPDDTTFRLFEANEERQEATFAKDKINACVGARVGRAEFHVYEFESCSSLYQVNPDHASEVTGNPRLKTWGDHAPIKETRRVWMTTIDHVAALTDAPDFLSLDAQGGEYDILKGATNTLPSILAVLTEFQTAEVYKGQGLLHDQSKLLHDAGFRLADIIYREFWERDGTKLLTAGDALFLNFNTLVPDRIVIRDRIAAFFGLK